MVQRREGGDGGLSFDRNADRWVGRLDLGRGPDGKRIRVKITARTRTDARKKLDALREQHRAGVVLTDRAVTFAELAALWMERGLPAGTADITRRNYETLIQSHLTEPLGKRRVASLRPDDFDAVLDAMAEAGYSGRTMRLTLNLARRILKLGERRGLVVRNVAAVVEPPEGPRRERPGLTADQANSLLVAAADHRLGNLITVSLLLGLRPGEAAGLTWDAVDLDGDPPTIRVQASLRRAGRTMQLVAPKTPTSHRTLALPHACVEALRSQRHRQELERRSAGGEWANNQNLVFTTINGTPLDPSNARRTLKVIADRAGLGHIHPHLLRHAAASLLSDAGVALEDIADTLGHRSVTVTADVYRHPLAPIRTGHMAAMSAFGNAQSEPPPTPGPGWGVGRPLVSRSPDPDLNP
jgi:integrase